MQNWMQKSYFTRLTFKLHTLSKKTIKKNYIVKSQRKRDIKK